MDFHGWGLKGKRSRTAKLTIEQVLAIRKEYDAGLRGKDRAAAFEIARVTYDGIGRRKRWAQVPEKED